MEYMSALETAKKRGISERRVQKLCAENRIPGVQRISRMWLIPKDAKKPIDGRTKNGRRKKANRHTKSSTRIVCAFTVCLIFCCIIQCY